MVLLIRRGTVPIVTTVALRRLQRDDLGSSSQRIEVVRPRLHHLRALFEVFGPVVRRTVGVSDSVCQLCFDDIDVEIQPLSEHRSSCSPKSMPSLKI